MSNSKALRVWNWFLHCLDRICSDARLEEKKGAPRILLATPSGCPRRAFTLILIAGGTRILYDLVPCISFRGWPQIAAAWLQESGRFWQRAGLPHHEAAGAFHLLPGLLRDLKRSTAQVMRQSWIYANNVGADWGILELA